ncbi:MAG: flagellar hook capping FlgD N-terminal domain-containing protein [Bryobacteraceae bacterium]
MASPVSAVTSAANPAATASSSNSTTSAGANQQISEATFLQLLVAQLQNQDPLQPMDGMQFVTQLAQFSQLESVYGIQKDTDSLVADAGAASSSSTSGSSSSSGSGSSSSI